MSCLTFCSTPSNASRDAARSESTVGSCTERNDILPISTVGSTRSTELRGACRAKSMWIVPQFGVGVKSRWSGTHWSDSTSLACKCGRSENGESCRNTV